MKEIALLVHADAGQEARFAVAADLAVGLDGHLACVDVVSLRDEVYRNFGGMAAGLLLHTQFEAEHRNKAALNDRIAGRGIACSWTDAEGRLDTALVAAAQRADLLVVSTLLPGDVEYPDMAATIRRVLRHVHTPILAVPPHARGLKLDGRVVVLWDGSADAEAAMIAAVPLLARAAHVTVLHVEDRPLALPLREATDYLHRQGILTHTSRQGLWSGGAAQAIAHYIVRHVPDLVVMGAFGHGRLHDALFGSVTGHLLAAGPAPLLLARRR
jgi:nucleotide-binding universal stress UspA family protein